MLQNARAAAFTVCELLIKRKSTVGVKLPPPSPTPPRLGLNLINWKQLNEFGNMRVLTL